MNQRCGHCKASEIAVHSGSRSLALMRFAQLQRQGHLPSMCESENGQFTVCYDADCRLEQPQREIAVLSAA